MKKVKNFLSLILCLFMIAACFSGCGQDSSSASNQGKSANQVLTLSLEDFESLDPQVGTSSEVANVGREIYNSLLTYDTNNNLVPDLLAAMPTVSADGLKYSFELKPNIKFCDGEVLKSSDVKYTFERMLLPQTKACNGWFIDMIKGASDMENGKAAALSGFKIVDDTKFEITLEKPYSPFLQSIASVFVSIFPEKGCKTAGDNWGKQPIGTGPFMVKSWNKGEDLILVKNPYFNKPVKISEIDYKVISDDATTELEFKSGTIDEYDIPTEKYNGYKNDAKYKNNVMVHSSLHTSYITFNNTNKYLKDARVREAISIAIDRDKLCKDVLNGTAEPAYTFLAPGMIGYDSNARIEYNQAKAKELLKEAGYPNGFSINIYQTQNSKSRLDLNTALQGMLEPIGVKLNIVQVDDASFIDMRNNGKITMYSCDWWADFDDPDNFLYSICYSQNSLRRSLMYSNKDLDNMLVEARSITDNAKRNELYKKADHKICEEDYAIAPLSHNLDIRVFSPNLKGYWIPPVTGIIYYGDAYKE